MDESTAMEFVQRDIRYLVWKFCQANPQLDREELIAECQIPALKAIRNHSPEKSSLRTWTSYKVWNFLNAHLRYKGWRSRLGKCYNHSLLDQPENARFSLADLLWQVSAPAAELIQLIVSRELTSLHGIRWPKDELSRVINELKEVFQ